MPEVIAGRLVLETVPDTHPRREHRFVRKVEEINDQYEMQHFFRDQEFVSLRGVFNNLDYDERSLNDYTKNTDAGNLLFLSSLSYLQTYEYDYQEAPIHLEHILKHSDIDDSCAMDQEISMLVMHVFPNVSSYLFGRQFLNYTDGESEEIVYRMSENLLHHLMVELSDAVIGIEYVHEIFSCGMITGVAARWEQNFMTVWFQCNECDVRQVQEVIRTKSRG